MKPKKILLTAGGTGGHTYPAQGLAQQMMSSDCEILFVAGGLSKNRYFDRTQFSYQEVSCSPIITKNPFKLLKGMMNMARGIWQSIKILKRFKPDVVVGFGSYYTVPILIAAKALNIPILLHEANSIPGKANQWFAPYAICTGILFPSTASLLRGPSVEVGLPLREGYKASKISKNEARAYFQLDDSIFTILIFGGSQGAKAINDACLNINMKLKSPLQIIHLTGKEAVIQTLKNNYEKCNIKANVKAFESRMDLAWTAADVFIGRSGASTIAEAMEFEVPGLLIPFPYATENHQEKNAAFLVNDVKGAYILLEKNMTPEQLMDKIQHLFLEYRQLCQNIKIYKQRPNKIEFHELVMNVIKEKSYE